MDYRRSAAAPEPQGDTSSQISLEDKFRGYLDVWSSLVEDDDTTTYPQVSGTIPQPPTYERTQLVDGYKWPVPQPIEHLMDCDEILIPVDFSCQSTSANVSPCGHLGPVPDYQEQDGALTVAQSGMIKLPCGHAFHPYCINKELGRKAYARCPVCQHTLHYRLCHHRMHIPYFAPGTVMLPDELDGACRACAPVGFIQEIYWDIGPRPVLPDTDRRFFDVDFGWHWWIVSVIEGGHDRYVSEHFALQERLFRICGGADFEKRKEVIDFFDAMMVLHIRLKHPELLTSQQVLSGSHLDGRFPPCVLRKTPQVQAMFLWHYYLGRLVEIFHEFHVRGKELWQPQTFVPFMQFYCNIKDLTDGAV